MIADCWVMMFAWLVRAEAQRCERRDPGSVGDPTGPILVSVAGRVDIPGAAVVL